MGIRADWVHAPHFPSWAVLLERHNARVVYTAWQRLCVHLNPDYRDMS